MKNLFLILFVLVSTFSNAQNTSTNHANLSNGLAVQGYDVVAYFKENKAAKGKKEHSTKHNGIIYYFNSKENKEAFVKKPSAYEPQYGGWCAFAMGDYGEKVAINPETFKIVEGKLYLFYNAYFTNTLKSWNKNESVLKAKADANWKKITN